jgi:hypothetical protein
VSEKCGAYALGRVLRGVAPSVGLA